MGLFDRLKSKPKPEARPTLRLARRVYTATPVKVELDYDTVNAKAEQLRSGRPTKENPMFAKRNAERDRLLRESLAGTKTTNDRD